MNYTLTCNPVTKKYPYLMKQKNAVVTAETTLESALWMLKQGKVHQSDEFPGYPITANDEYFFAGEIEQPACGSDYCEIPELNDKPKQRKKRIKDVVCE